MLHNCIRSIKTAFTTEENSQPAMEKTLEKPLRTFAVAGEEF